jgi:hypothetical protein
MDGGRHRAGPSLKGIWSALMRKAPGKHRGGAESVKSKIGHLASYARIAIHIGEFST